MGYRGGCTISWVREKILLEDFGTFFGVWFRRFARQFLARPAHPTAAFLGLTRECLSQPIA